MLSTKKLEKLEKALGLETVNDLHAMNADELKARLIQAEQGIKLAEDELDANNEYQTLLESKKAMEEGLKDVKKRQNAIIKYSLHLIEEKGTE